MTINHEDIEDRTREYRCIQHRRLHFCTGRIHCGHCTTSPARSPTRLPCRPTPLRPLRRLNLPTLTLPTTSPPLTFPHLRLAKLPSLLLDSVSPTLSTWPNGLTTGLRRDTSRSLARPRRAFTHDCPELERERSALVKPPFHLPTTTVSLVVSS